MKQSKLWCIFAFCFLPLAALATETTTFKYNAIGQRLWMVDHTGTNTYSYDLAGRLKQKVTPLGTINYRYDPAGNITNVFTSTTNGTWIAYQYDALDRLTNVVDRFGNKTTYTYDGAGNITNITYPNKVTNSFAFNSVDFLTNATSRKGSILARYDCQVRGDGLKTSVTEYSGRTASYNFDRANRLTNETVSGGTVNGSLTYVYDEVGNRLNRFGTLGSLGPNTNSYSVNDKPANETHDLNGNTITNAAGHVLAYDYQNRLTNFNNQVEFGYDGDDFRVWKKVGSTNTFYLVDELSLTGYPQVLEELTTVGATPAKLYTYGLDLISERLSAGSTYFYGYDGCDNVRFLTDTNGAVVATYDFDAFGSLLSGSMAIPNNYLFQGEQTDAETGNVFLRARYYSPISGRMLTADEFEGDPRRPITLHRYLFANVDPVNNSDPSGHFALMDYLGGFSSLISFAQNTGPKLSQISGMARRASLQIPTSPDEQLLAGLIFAESSTKKVGGENESEKIEIGLTVLNRTHFAVLKDKRGRRHNRDFGNGTILSAMSAERQFLGYNNNRWKLVMQDNRMKTPKELSNLDGAELEHLVLSLEAAKEANNGSAPLPTGLLILGGGESPVAFNKAKNTPPGPRMMRFATAGSTTFYMFKPGREAE